MEPNVEIRFVPEEGAIPPEDGKVVFMNPKDLGPWPFNDLPNLPQTPASMAALRQSITENGVTTPIIVWADSGKSRPPVLAGNTRRQLAEEEGLELVPVIFKPFATREAAKLFSLRDNMERREIGVADRARMGDELWRLFDAAPDKREMAAQGMTPRKRAAVAAHVAEGTLAEYRYTAENATGEVKAKLAAGELSVHAAYKITCGALAEKSEAAAKSVRTEKLLDEFKALAATLRKLPDLALRTQAAVKSLAGAKAAERERVGKKLNAMAAVLDAVEKEQTLTALRSALAGNDPGGNP